jgi:hypothetical protein
MRIVYHWYNGSYVNSLSDQFQQDYEELRAQFGDPISAQVLYEEDPT